MRETRRRLAWNSRIWADLVQPCVSWANHGILFLIVALLTVGCVCRTAPVHLPLSTAPFLGPRDFAGTYVPKATPATIGGNATYNGNIVFTNLDRTLVEAVLPADLKLAQNSVSPALHPVMYLYGRPSNTSWIVAGTPILIGPNYQELMLVIPFVQERNGTHWHNYVVRMYLDDWNAIVIGNVFFGYAKLWGTSQESGADVTEFDQGGTSKFHATILATGPWQPERASRNVAAELRRDTVDSRDAHRRLELVTGQLVCSYFELDYTNATVAPVQSTHEFVSPFVPGMAGWVALGTLSSVANGAVAVRNVNWRIEQPPAPPCNF